MDKKVCLDTDVCIAILKKDSRVKNLLVRLAKTEVAITTVTLFELRLRTTHLDDIERFVEHFDILPFDAFSAEKASNIFKERKKKGRMVDIRDTFIAGTVIAHGCVFATMNEKHFRGITGLEMF